MAGFPISGVDYRWHDVWPRKRRDLDLPPGQRVAPIMPRFSARPRRPPPTVPSRPVIEVKGAVDSFEIPLDQLSGLPRVELTADFHCVTTWSIPGLHWSGWRFDDVWGQIVMPALEPAATPTHVRAVGHDGYSAVLDLRDALQGDVTIVDSLEGRPLDRVHGAPLRLVSPAQYGYKSVKHLAMLVVHTSEPRRGNGKIEHPRARVDIEERHASISGRLLRWPYRLLIVPTALMGRRSARRGGSAE